MKYNMVAAFAALLAVTQAVPASIPNTSNKVVRDWENYCGNSTFVDATSGASPYASDCQHITENIADGGTWDINPFGSQRQLVQYGSCAFGVESTDSDSFTISIGNEDIISLITDSIAQFEWEDQIGAEGSMYCGEAQSTIAWGIYST